MGSIRQGCESRYSRGHLSSGNKPSFLFNLPFYQPFFTPPLNTHSFPIPFHQSYVTPPLSTSSFLIPFHQSLFTPPLNTSFFLIPFHQSYFTFPHKTSSFPIPFLCPSISLYPTPLPTLFIYPLPSILPIFPLLSTNQPTLPYAFLSYSLHCLNPLLQPVFYPVPPPYTGHFPFISHSFPIPPLHQPFSTLPPNLSNLLFS